MSDCIFCKIAAKQIPSQVVFEDDTVLAFRDLNPQAPEHVLIIPKEHVVDSSKVSPENEALVGHCIAVSAQIGKTLGLVNGYRLVTNVGEEAGQTVMHLHIHMLGGRKLTWPPG